MFSKTFKVIFHIKIFKPSGVYFLLYRVILGSNFTFILWKVNCPNTVYQIIHPLTTDLFSSPYTLFSSLLLPMNISCLPNLPIQPKSLLAKIWNYWALVTSLNQENDKAIQQICLNKQKRRQTTSSGNTRCHFSCCSLNLGCSAYSFSKYSLIIQSPF